MTYSSIKRLNSFILIFTMYGLFAISFVIGKKTLEYSSPFFLTATRFLFAGIALLFFQFIFKKNLFHVPKQSWWKIGVLAVFNIFLTNGLEFWGLQYLTSFNTCFLYSMSPFLSEKALESTFVISWAETAVIGASIATVIGWITMRSVVSKDNCPLLMANGISMLLGGVLSMITSVIFESWNPIPVSALQVFILGTLIIVIITNFISYNLYAHLLKNFTATFLSFCGFSTPIMTAIFAWIFLRESVTINFIIAAIIVFAGLYLFSKDELKLERTKE